MEYLDDDDNEESEGDEEYEEVERPKRGVRAEPVSSATL